jgi:hypothetical protein
MSGGSDRGCKPVHASLPDFLPVRMLNEFTYCPRLAYLEWVQGEFTDNAYTIEGTFEHRRAAATDAGFADIARHPPGGTPGVVLLCTKRQDKFTFLELIHRFVAPTGTRSLSGSIWIVTGGLFAPPLGGPDPPTQPKIPDSVIRGY